MSLLGEEMESSDSDSESLTSKVKLWKVHSFSILDPTTQCITPPTAVVVVENPTLREDDAFMGAQMLAVLGLQVNVAKSVMITATGITFPLWESKSQAREVLKMRAQEYIQRKKVTKQVGSIAPSLTAAAAAAPSGAEWTCSEEVPSLLNLSESASREVLKMRAQESNQSKKVTKQVGPIAPSLTQTAAAAPSGAEWTSREDLPPLLNLSEAASSETEPSSSDETSSEDTLTPSRITIEDMGFSPPHDTPPNSEKRAELRDSKTPREPARAPQPTSPPRGAESTPVHGDYLMSFCLENMTQDSYEQMCARVHRMRISRSTGVGAASSSVHMESSVQVTTPRSDKCRKKKGKRKGASSDE